MDPNLTRAFMLLVCVISSKCFGEESQEEAKKLLTPAQPVKYGLMDEGKPFLGLVSKCITVELVFNSTPYTIPLDFSNGNDKWSTHLYTASISTFPGPGKEAVITFQPEEEHIATGPHYYRLQHVDQRNCFVLASTYTHKQECYLFSKLEKKPTVDDAKDCPLELAQSTSCSEQYKLCKTSANEQDICLAWL